MRKITPTRISKIAIAIGFGVVICGVAMRPALAGGHGGGAQHHEERHGNQHRGGHGGGGYIAPAPNAYYAPAPNYYYAPEPEYYPAGPTYSAPPPSEGVNLFFGLNSKGGLSR